VLGPQDIQVNGQGTEVIGKYKMFKQGEVPADVRSFQYFYQCGKNFPADEIKRLAALKADPTKGGP